MLRIGLTGGIGSGKSTVGNLFSELGVPLIDADQVARDVVAPDTPALQAIRETFGENVIGPDGALDRRKMRERVFSDDQARSTLEALLHPIIRDEIRRRVAALAAPYCLIAIPLLVEKGWQGEVDRVLVVDTEPERQLERIVARDGVSRSQAEAVLKAQASRQERLAAADNVIENNDDLASLREKVTMAHHRYLALAGGDTSR